MVLRTVSILLILRISLPMNIEEEEHLIIKFLDCEAKCRCYNYDWLEIYVLKTYAI